tara:strand:+ start:91 stop:318 length:228 start_codon:yes stop_codon:yes gene_type:complete
LILVFSAVVGAWTSVLLLSNTTSKIEIKEVINKMYLNQKDFIYNVKDLSLLLVKDANERFSNINNDTNQFNKLEN